MSDRRLRGRTILPLAISLALHGAAFAAFLDWHRQASVGSTDAGIPVTLVIESGAGKPDAPAEEVVGVFPADTVASIPIISPADAAPAARSEPTIAALAPVENGPVDAESPRARGATPPPRPPPRKPSATNSGRRGPAPPPSQIAEVASAAPPSAEVTNVTAVGAGGDSKTTAPSGASLSADSDYLATIMAALARHKHYPDSARLRGEEGIVLVAFAVDRSGRVLSLDVRRSSGSNALDEAAEAMVRATEPLPPAPPSLPSTRLEIVLPISFSLH